MNKLTECFRLKVPFGHKHQERFAHPPPSRASPIVAGGQRGVNGRMFEKTVSHAYSTGTYKESIPYDYYAEACSMNKLKKVICKFNFDLNIS